MEGETVSGIMQTITSPRDLSDLSLTEMKQLAREVRREIIYTVSKNGGHLAPNLGIVELTLALHRVFASPRDKLIWDVGHQSYAHKLLTKRWDKFHTLRQFEGLSGFPRPQESEHDTFGTGHASTSISAGLGMVLARDLEGEDYRVIPIIGDGAMTGGMAFEALNHAGHLKKNLIVVLNDNEMSICPNVGGLASYFTRLRTDPMYYRSKDEIEHLLRKIPNIGHAVLRIMERIKDSLKYLVVPGMFFEELGFLYFGPVDGHDLKCLVDILKQAGSAKGPVLVHVITRKGKGYRPAEENADKFHSTGPFNILDGKSAITKDVPTYTEVFGKTVTEEAAKNKKIVAITAAMGRGTGLTEFSTRYPHRFFDVGIAEQHAVTMAAGMARSGYKPVVAIYSTFLQRAYDQVLHDVCLQNLPVVFAIDRAGLVGDDGPTHHGLFDFAYLRTVPNMTLMAPKDEDELRGMLITALRHQGPCAVRYPRGAGRGVPLDREPPVIPVGRAEVLSEGRDITFIAAGNCVSLAERAAQTLASAAIGASVINARFIKPLDAECILHYGRLTGKVITVEEHVLPGGFGSAIFELFNEHNAGSIELARLGVPDCFVEHGSREQLRAKYGLTVEHLVNRALKMLGAPAD
ncbi:MAG: 1-deoxy-D-xylulose-5-phosphate synthase [Firmicutes bacterium]|nr:1-deoxy-D-xylulose-5-phosphate synthase [Bacillota bacterium]